MSRPASHAAMSRQGSVISADAKISDLADPSVQPARPRQDGILIINADDWGRSRETTDRILECVRRRAVSSVSAMVFMEDSERSAGSALEAGVDAGLHLNLTSSFSTQRSSDALRRHHEKAARYLTSHRLAQALYHPLLSRSFEYLVAAQVDEFRRLYQRDPERIDGHHHMHLCANVLFPGLLPAGTIARRNFSFQRGQKSLLNRLYRRGADLLLSRRHRLTDFFFSLPPLEPASRLQQIFTLARQFVVEVETHPINPGEYRFLSEGRIFAAANDVAVATRFVVR